MAMLSTLFLAAASARIYHNHNNVGGQIPEPKASTPSIKFLGEFANVSACQAGCVKMAGCTSFTWHGADFAADWAEQCYGRVDGVWEPVRQDGIDSGLVRNSS